MFVEKIEDDSMIQPRTGTLDAPIRQDMTAGVADYFASKYIGKMVYVWKGHFKNKVGRVMCIGGPYARLSFTGAFAGNGIQTVKRELLIRYAIR